MANTVKKTTKTTTKTTAKTTDKTQGRPAHSGFEAPVYGVKATGPAKYLPNGDINPEWKKQGKKK